MTFRRVGPLALTLIALAALLAPIPTAVAQAACPLVAPTPVAPSANDSDGDGLSNGGERATDANDPDSDDDGLSDGYEARVGGLSPTRADSDNDGVVDGEDDHDNDGFSNCDEARESTDINVARSNPNAQPPIAPTPLSPTTADRDGDLYGNVGETLLTNPDNADSDRDGLADGYEVRIAGMSPSRADSDNDGLLDGEDDHDGDGFSNFDEANASTDPNVAESNPDAESIVVPAPVAPTETDSDGDGLRDAAESFLTNPNEPDSDRDGLSDGYENRNATVSPYRADSDNNGTLDGEDDHDGDGFSNCDEAAAGSAINDPQSTPPAGSAGCGFVPPPCPGHPSCDPDCATAGGLIEAPTPADDPNINVNNVDHYPAPTFARPAQGETYCDPVFGSRITALPDGWRHVYAQLQAFSSDNAYVLAQNSLTGRGGVIDLATMTPDELPPGAENFVWMAGDQVAYILDAAGARSTSEIHSYDPVSQISTFRMDLPYTDIRPRSWESPSRDGRLWALYSQLPGEDDDRIGIVDLVARTLIFDEPVIDLPVSSNAQAQIDGDTLVVDQLVNNIAITPSGDGILIGFNPDGRGYGSGMELYDFQLQRGLEQPVLQVTNHRHHFDMGVDASGDDYLLTYENGFYDSAGVVQGNLPNLVTHDLSGPGADLISVINFAAFSHVSAQGGAGSPVVVSSPEDVDPLVTRTMFKGEIWLAGSDGTTQRLAHHRSRESIDTGTVGDQTVNQPSASISRDGSLVVFASNWGGTAAPTGYVIEVPASPVTVDPDSSVNPVLPYFDPDPAAGFDYQIGGDYDPGPDVTKVSRDWYEGTTAGVGYPICYVNAFQTQPDPDDGVPAGSRPDYTSNWIAGAGADVVLTQLGDDPEWEGEYLIDIRPGTRQAAFDHVAPMLETCAGKGFAAVEFDNLDSWTRFDEIDSVTVPFGAAEAEAFAAMLTERTHELGMASAQKNTWDFIEEPANGGENAAERIGFDLVIVEECGESENDEDCDDFVAAYGQDTILIEYMASAFSDVCSAHGAVADVVLRDLDVEIDTDDDYVREFCPVGTP